MSRFVDRTVTERFVLGPCECPGTPHDEDWIKVRTEISATEAVEIGDLNWTEALAVLAVEWNLLDADGSAAPVDEAHIGLLFPDDVGRFREWCDAHLRTAITLPNASAAPSPSSTRASGSPRPRALKAG